jgi:hypothetical protein
MTCWCKRYRAGAGHENHQFGQSKSLPIVRGKPERIAPMAGILNRIKQLAQAISGPVRAAGKVVLGSLLPGANKVVELIAETLGWGSGDSAETPPPASPAEYQLTAQMLEILQTQLDELAEVANALQSDRQEGYIRGRLIHDTDMPEVLQRLDDLAQQFDRFRHNQEKLLQQQLHHRQRLDGMLQLTSRLVGISDLLSEMQAERVEYPNFDMALQLFQQGASALSDGDLKGSLTNFQQLAQTRPQSRAASLALGTVRVVSLPPNDPSLPAKVEQLLARIPPKVGPPAGSRRLRSLTDHEVRTVFTGQSQLTDLIIWDCSCLTDVGLQWLCYLLPNLSRLSLRKGHQITDGSIPSLSALSLLRSLLVWGAHMSLTGQQRLMDCCPGLALNIR